MTIKSCRGPEKKQNIVDEYDVSPLAHVMLLPGQEKQGCCGKLERTYYLFEAIPKGGSGNKETFYVGDHCANEFLSLIDHEGIPLFNPLAPNIEAGGGNNTNEGGNGLLGRRAMDPLNRELFVAVNLLCIAWNSPPYGSFLSFLKYVTDRPEVRTKTFIIENLNKAIKKGGREEQTLTEIIESLREKWPNVRVYEFPLIKTHLLDNNIQSYI